MTIRKQRKRKGRRNLAEAQHWKCAICKRKIARRARASGPNGLSIDHIIPLSRGGLDKRGNIRVVHRACNTAKGNLLDDEMSPTVRHKLKTQRLNS